MAQLSELTQFSAGDLPEHVSVDEAYANKHTQSILARHKREGLKLAVRARWVALAVVAAMLPFLNWDPEIIYYEVMLLVLAGVGWLQLRVGKLGRSRAEFSVLALDIVLMVFVLLAPNPLSDRDWPTAMIYQFDPFMYLYIILSVGTLSYSWRTILAIGNLTAIVWLVALGLVWWFGSANPDLTAALQTAWPNDPELVYLKDPSQFHFDQRIQEIVVFVLIAGTLAMTVRRFNRLLISNAALERERENLSRYFSPNVVEELSNNDEPLKQIRSHDVAVIFVDIQGFTHFAADKNPQDVINTLRSFHAIMERAVFAQGGTLDKYLGDGLMATFGTPFPSPDDVRRAYHCSRRMVDLAEDWNRARIEAGEEPLRVSVGLHSGPVVLGDIGGNRLEFAVIGNTVNVASRLEALSRPLKSRLVVSHDVQRALPEEEVQDLTRIDGQSIRGIDQDVTVWTLH